MKKVDSFACRDDLNEDYPTCGSFFDRNTQKKIPNSQGFCCECDWLDLGGGSSTRGQTCGLINVISTAHCLRFSEENDLYKGYNI